MQHSGPESVQQERKKKLKINERGEEKRGNDLSSQKTKGGNCTTGEINELTGLIHKRMYSLKYGTGETMRPLNRKWRVTFERCS